MVRRKRATWFVDCYLRKNLRYVTCRDGLPVLVLEIPVPETWLALIRGNLIFFWGWKALKCATPRFDSCNCRRGLSSSKILDHESRRIDTFRPEVVCGTWQYSIISECPPAANKSKMAPHCHAKNIPPKAYLMQFWGGIYARLLTGLTLFLLSFPLSSRGGGKCSAYSDQKSAAQTQDFHEYLISVCLCVCVLELRSLALETSKRIYVPQKSGRRARRLKSNRAVDLLIEKVNRVFPPANLSLHGLCILRRLWFQWHASRSRRGGLPLLFLPFRRRMIYD